MWKEMLEKLVESFACMDPFCYGYYVAAKLEAERPTPTAREDADETALRNLIDRLQVREEASA
jgi:hypothetical protein